MEPQASHESPAVGHPRLLRCTVKNPAGETSVRYVELEQFRLWEYMMRTRHNIEVNELQLGLWMPASEYRSKSELLAHSGEVEDVSCAMISWFNPRHHYTLDIVRYVPTDQYESVKQILLSHISQSRRQSDNFQLTELHGVCVSRVIEDPEVELILGLSDMEIGLDESNTV